jgi:hypothetical protein
MEGRMDENIWRYFLRVFDFRRPQDFPLPLWKGMNHPKTTADGIQVLA